MDGVAPPVPGPILEWLAITPDEQRQLRELAAPELKAERRRKVAKEWDAANPERARERDKRRAGTDKRRDYMRDYMRRKRAAETEQLC